MKIQFLEQVIAQIQDEIHCPKCKHSFRKDQIEVRSVQKNQIEFSTRCTVCGAESHISANIGVSPIKKPNHQLVLPHFEAASSEKKLAFEDVTDVFSSLKNFKGRDVRTLFNDASK